MIKKDEEKKLKHFPDAYPTSKGWMNPNTGELLVSIKGLANAIDLETVERKDWKEYVQQEILKRREDAQKQLASQIVTPKEEKVKPEKPVKAKKETVKKSAKKKTDKK